MKNYTITVNGNVYDVTVEETGSTPSTASRLRPELPERYLSSRLRLAMQ